MKIGTGELRRNRRSPPKNPSFAGAQAGIAQVICRFCDTFTNAGIKTRPWLEWFAAALIRPPYWHYLLPQRQC